jgi:hypothetical protein
MFISYYTVFILLLLLFAISQRVHTSGENTEIFNFCRDGNKLLRGTVQIEPADAVSRLCRKHWPSTRRPGNRLCGKRRVYRAVWAHSEFLSGIQKLFRRPFRCNFINQMSKKKNIVPHGLTFYYNI